VKVAYTGRFLSGEIFEWKDDQDAIIFRLGQGEVCTGLERAIVTMKKREVAEVKLQPKYAFGAEGQPPTYAFIKSLKILSTIKEYLEIHLLCMKLDY
jgi:FKBP-type peptidyl-prolyl cis-trans isomerase 2